MNDSPHSRNSFFRSVAEETLFTENLNRSFCAISHLSERLTDVEEGPDFKDLATHLAPSLKFAEKKSAVLDKLYELIGKTPDFDKCNVLINLLEELFDQIRLGDTFGIREVLLANYVDFINYTTHSSLSILQFLGRPISYPALHSLISELDTKLALNFETKS